MAFDELFIKPGFFWKSIHFRTVFYTGNIVEKLQSESTMLALFCLSIFIVGCYGQVGYHGNQYVPYTIPSQNGGYATYLRPNYQAIRPLQTEVGLTGGASSATGSGYSGYYTPYSYVLNLQQDRGKERLSNSPFFLESVNKIYGVNF